MKSKLFLTAAWLFSICNFAYAETVTVTNFGSWDGSTYISNWGSGPNTTKTYGQAILIFPQYDSINNFSLYFKLLSGSPQSYVFSIYRMSQTYGIGALPLPTNPFSTNVTPIFSTGVLVAPNTTNSFTKVTYDLGNLVLDAGSNPSIPRAYLASISTLNIGNSDGQYGLGGVPGNNFSGFNYTNENNIETRWLPLDAAAVYEFTALSN